MGENDDDQNCHFLLCLTPEWARPLANRKFFMICYGLILIVQGMMFMFLISALNTIESHFQLPSEVFGTIMCVGELSIIANGVLTGLFVGMKTHRPIGLAISLIVMGIGCHLYALPYFLYGSPIPLNETSSRSLCVENPTDYIDGVCVASLMAPSGTTVWGVGMIFFVSYCVSQVGGNAIYIIGTPFVDDNVESKNSPMYLALLSCIRTIGPVFGTFLATATLAINVDPSKKMQFSDRDSRSVGAWWLGSMTIGFLSFLCAFLVAQFPRRLLSTDLTPAVKTHAELEMEELKTNLAKIEQRKILLANIRRVISNVMLWLRTFSEIFLLFGLQGFMMYIPKYIQHEFHVSASEASIWTGSAIVFPSAIGDIIVGLLVQRLHPTMTQLAGALIGAKSIFTVIMIILPNLRCQKSDLLGSGSMFPVCETGCDCKTTVFSPICGSDGQSYFSPCHAGCTSFIDTGSDENTIFTNCSCILNGGNATTSLCELACPEKYGYLILVVISQLCLSFAGVAGMLFILRIVEPRDKTIATGFFSACLGVFTFLPCPLVFSAAVDATCDVWSEQCGRVGACNVYDMNALRSLMHIAPSALFVVSVGIDVAFWWLSKKRPDIKLFDDVQKDTEMEDKVNSVHDNDTVGNDKNN